MTEKLFYDDQYLRKFTATVISCERIKNGFSVVLDRSAFYPEGGGQPFDTGTIGETHVLEVHAKGDTIFHLLDSSLNPGETIECVVDWNRRFGLMQSHTGEHIVSGLIHQAYGLENVGFHMGSDAVTIDLSAELTWKQLMEIEARANLAIYQNLPVEITHPSSSALATLSYRSKKELSGDIRIVSIPSCDVCACCGTHTARTGEIGLIKLISSQHYKGGVRVRLLFGSAALADYAAKNDMINKISSGFSTKPENIVESIARQGEELTAIKMHCNALQSELFSLKAGKIPNGQKVVCIFEDSLSPDELRRYSLALASRALTAAVFSGTGESEWKYAISCRNGDARIVSRSLLSSFSGRGGGSAELAQGSVSGAERAELQKWLEDNA